MLIRTPSLMVNDRGYEAPPPDALSNEQKIDFLRASSQYVDEFMNYDGFDNTKEKDITVCVTGATGFIGSHCVNQLLIKGYKVHGTVRGDPNRDKYKWLYQLQKYSNKNSLTLFQADLLTPNSFDLAIKGCDFVFHVASPVKLNVNDYVQDMLKPAVDGTLNVLNSCLKQSLTTNSKLKRVVMTSSLYAVYGIPKDNKMYDESDWDDDFTIDTQPYAYSKTEAERAAWNWMEQNKSKTNHSFDLISICPSLVIGAQLNGDGRLTASNVCIYSLLKGRLGRINSITPITDVRDIAAAHLFFIDNKRALNKGSGRYCCWGKGVLLSSFIDQVQHYCNENEIESPIPCCKLCCKCDYFICGCLFKCCILCCCLPRRYAQWFGYHINKGVELVSDEKIKSLGFKFRDENSTIRYTLDYFLNQEIVLKKE